MDQVQRNLSHFNRKGMKFEMGRYKMMLKAKCNWLYFARVNGNDDECRTKTSIRFTRTFRDDFQK
jgi:hypothetical protein